MKRFVLILGCLGLAGFVLSQSQQDNKITNSRPQVNTVGLVAHYKLQYGPMTPSEVFDYSLNGFVGTLTGTDIAPAYPGFRMNGTDDFIDVGTGPTSVKTVVMWIKPDDVAGNDAVIDLNGTDALLLITSTLKMSGFVGGTLYVDGVAGTTVTANWHLLGVTVATGKNANALLLGQASIFLNGLMGETFLFDRVLSPAEIRSIYEITRPTYGR